MRYISVCSGIEAATVAWHHMGWTPAWFSEIEPFPSAVLAHHYPEVKNLGDMTKYEEWPDEPIELLVGGTPCQAFSVAGLRQGLADPRGGLMLTYLEIARRYRPRWVVWENVPGVLSSGKGRDFGAFLGALGELGYGFAYRVLDAQWFGVAQRRRRVFVVGYLGSWERAAAVLFKRESVRRDTPPSREAGQEVAGTIAARFGISRNNHEECVAQTVGALCADTHPGAYSGQDAYTGRLVPHIAAFAKTHKPMSVTDPEGWAPTPVSPTITHWPRDRSDTGTDVAVTQTIDAIPIHDQATRFAGKRGTKQDGKGNGLGIGLVGDPCPTLTRGDKHAVAAYIGGIDYENNAHRMDEPTGPLLKGSPTGSGHPLPAVATALQVRRLTPTECERLQGFPDGYTNIPWRKKPEAPDGPRYKALGNSMAVPVMRWIGERIRKVDNEQ